MTYLPKQAETHCTLPRNACWCCSPFAGQYQSCRACWHVRLPNQLWHIEMDGFNFSFCEHLFIQDAGIVKVPYPQPNSTTVWCLPLANPRLSSLQKVNTKASLGLIFKPWTHVNTVYPCLSDTVQSHNSAAKGRGHRTHQLLPPADLHNSSTTRSKFQGASESKSWSTQDQARCNWHATLPHAGCRNGSIGLTWARISHSQDPHTLHPELWMSQMSDLVRSYSNDQPLRGEICSQ